MTAWRRPGKQQQLSLLSQEQQRPVLETGYDDDGEKYGGKTLEKVLREGSLEGAVMVARWYGGVMLGPVRFEHIKNCAKEAVEMSNQKDESHGEKDEEGRAGKRIKPADEAERQRLISILEERDLSIGVLRGLLADKKRELEGSSPKDEAGRASMPSKETEDRDLGRDTSRQRGTNLVSLPSKGANYSTNYATMESSTLTRLEQVRDKTIGWILIQIEDVEKTQLKESSSLLLGALEKEELKTGEAESLNAGKDPGASRRDCGTAG